jgi:hypothetical protein
MSNQEMILAIVIAAIIIVHFITQMKRGSAQTVPPTFSQLKWKRYKSGPMERPDFRLYPDQFIPWGKAANMYFDNGFGVSVVRHYDSGGSESGRYELAVLRLQTEAELAGRSKGDDGIWIITHGTDITNGTLGWLNETEVTETMQRVWILDEDGTEPIKYTGDSK